VWNPTVFGAYCGTTWRVVSIDSIPIGMSPSYLSTSELSQRWSQAPETIRRNVRSGLIRAIRVPGQRRLLIPLSFVLECEKPYQLGQSKLLSSIQ
jgi:hypothetical protein